MRFIKASVLISMKFLPPGQLYQSKTVIKCLKTSLNNVRNNHTGVQNLYDTSDFQKYLKFLEKEYSEPDATPPPQMRNVLSLLSSQREIENELKTLKEMSSEGSKELEEMIEKDTEMLSNKLGMLKNEIIESIAPVDDDNNRNVELQVVANIGGEEAKLFANEIFQMYLNYVKYKNWEHTGDESNHYIFINGENIYGKLRYEMGVHRVQRVPETENMGRTHTSTCTVLVLPQPRPGEVVFNEKEVIVETMRSSGPGGQNVNKTESCVRITHKPTGIVVENQTSRFQYENKRIALEKLRSIIFNRKQKELEDKVQKLRKKHVATNTYSDKIRTYNFNQNRVTDHRLQYTMHNIRGFLTGTKDLDKMVTTVRDYFIHQELVFHIQDVLESKEYKKFESQNSK